MEAKATSQQLAEPGQSRATDAKTGWSQRSRASRSVHEGRNDPEVGGRWLMGVRGQWGPWRQKQTKA